MKIVDYKILKSACAEYIEEKAIDLINAGYQPKDDLKVSVIPKGSVFQHVSSMYYVQVMVKYDQKSK
jgi:hypothetical protein